MKAKKTQSTVTFPSDKVLGKMRRKHSRGAASRPLKEKATEVEKLKHSICREFVVYSNSHKLTNREMAKRLGVAESLMSKILHYRFDEFTVDRLLSYLAKFFERIQVTIKVAG